MHNNAFAWLNMSIERETFVICSMKLFYCKWKLLFKINEFIDGTRSYNIIYNKAFKAINENYNEKKYGKPLPYNLRLSFSSNQNFSIN